MQVYNYKEILKKVTDEIGISEETLSICADTTIEFVKKPPLAIESKEIDKTCFLMLVMSLIVDNCPVGREDDYVITHIHSLEESFKIPRKIIAKYAGVEPQKLDSFMEHPDLTPVLLKYQIATAVLHLFSILTRNPSI